MKEDLFDVILESLESKSNGKPHFTVCLTREAERLNIPFDVYLKIFQQIEDEGKVFVRRKTKDYYYSICLLSF